MNVKYRYRCSECLEVHDDEDDARDCCRPYVQNLYVCGECSTHHDSESDARACCGGDGSVACPACMRVHMPFSREGIAVRVAGHCQVCNPSFTYDEENQISDIHEQHHGRPIKVTA